jgi:hypothetical protein
MDLFTTNLNCTLRLSKVKENIRKLKKGSYRTKVLSFSLFCETGSHGEEGAKARARPFFFFLTAMTVLYCRKEGGREGSWQAKNCSSSEDPFSRSITKQSLSGVQVGYSALPGRLCVSCLVPDF